jgi:hypothetical protein
MTAATPYARCSVPGVADVLVLQHQLDAPAGLLAGVLDAAARASSMHTMSVPDEPLPSPAGAGTQP